jgi:hypothetical protein
MKSAALSMPSSYGEFSPSEKTYMDQCLKTLDTIEDLEDVMISSVYDEPNIRLCIQPSHVHGFTCHFYMLIDLH